MSAPIGILPEELHRLHAIESVALDYAAWCAVADDGDDCDCGTCTSCRLMPLLGRERVLARSAEVSK